MKNNKGFTLVETLAVLVILAIMAAVAVPAMTGYIDSAKKKMYITEASTVCTAAQTYMMEEYAAKGSIDSFDFYLALTDYELGKPGNPLNDYLNGSFTEGAKIQEVYLDDNYVPFRFDGIGYLVNGYLIELRFGQETKVTKK